MPPSLSLRPPPLRPSPCPCPPFALVVTPLPVRAADVVPPPSPAKISGLEFSDYDPKAYEQVRAAVAAALKVFT